MAGIKLSTFPHFSLNAFFIKNRSYTDYDMRRKNVSESASLYHVFWHLISPFVFLQRDRESLADMEIRQAAERRRLIKEMQKEDDEEDASLS